jgi:ADP-ribose pyrophosphatase
MTDRRDQVDAGRGEEETEPLPRVLGSQMVYAGRVVSLRVDEIALPQGGTALREVVYHPGAVVVAALDSDGHVYLVKQYRHPVRRYLLELPAGGLEPGEEPLAAAKRELREEVGLEAREWTALGSFFSSPGFANERLHAFLARGLLRVPADPDDDEDISVVRYDLTGLLDRLEAVSDAKTLATLLLVSRAVANGLENAT